MKGILIDPQKQIIQDVSFKYENQMLGDMKKLIGCNYIERTSVSNKPQLDLWLDEEGRLKKNRLGKYFGIIPKMDSLFPKEFLDKCRTSHAKWFSNKLKMEFVNQYNSFVGPAIIVGRKMTADGLALCNPDINVRDLEARVVWLPDFIDDPFFEYHSLAKGDTH